MQNLSNLLPIGTIARFQDPGDFEVEVRITAYIHMPGLSFYVLVCTEQDELNVNIDPNYCNGAEKFYDLLPTQDYEQLSVICTPRSPRS